jgi:hypothetical protein
VRPVTLWPRIRRHCACARCTSWPRIRRHCACARCTSWPVPVCPHASIFETAEHIFMAVTMKDAVLWDITTPCTSFKNPEVPLFGACARDSQHTAHGPSVRCMCTRHPAHCSWPVRPGHVVARTELHGPCTTVRCGAMGGGSEGTGALPRPWGTRESLEVLMRVGIPVEIKRGCVPNRDRSFAA